MNPRSKNGEARLLVGLVYTSHQLQIRIVPLLNADVVRLASSSLHSDLRLAFSPSVLHRRCHSIDTLPLIEQHSPLVTPQSSRPKFRGIAHIASADVKSSKTAAPRSSRRSPPLGLDHARVGRIFTVYKYIRVPFSCVFLPPFDLDVRSPFHAFLFRFRLLLSHPRCLCALRRAPYNNLVKFPAFWTLLLIIYNATRPVAGSTIIKLVFSLLFSLLTQHVEYLSLRMTTLTPDLVGGRQSKPSFPSPFCVFVSSFSANRLTTIRASTPLAVFLVSRPTSHPHTHFLLYHFFVPIAAKTTPWCSPAPLEGIRPLPGHKLPVSAVQ